MQANGEVERTVRTAKSMLRNLQRPPDVQINPPTEWPLAERIANGTSPANTIASPSSQFVPQRADQRSSNSGKERSYLPIESTAQL